MIIVALRIQDNIIAITVGNKDNNKKTMMLLDPRCYKTHDQIDSNSLPTYTHSVVTVETHLGMPRLCGTGIVVDAWPHWS